MKKKENGVAYIVYSHRDSHSKGHGFTIQPAGTLFDGNALPFVPLPQKYCMLIFPGDLSQTESQIEMAKRIGIPIYDVRNKTRERCK